MTVNRSDNALAIRRKITTLCQKIVFWRSVLLFFSTIVRDKKATSGEFQK